MPPICDTLPAPALSIGETWENALGGRWRSGMLSSSTRSMDEKPDCKHGRTRLVAKDNDAEYIECLDCGALLEAGEVREAPRTDPAGFDESLSDA